MSKLYTTEQLDFLREQYRQKTLRDVTEAFNTRFGLEKLAAQIYSTLKNKKMVSGREPGIKAKARYQIWSEEQLQFLRDNYPKMEIPALTTALNVHFKLTRTIGQVRSATRNHSIISGRTGCFEKGQVSWNLGKKGYIGANATSFKKGSVPANRKRLWTERLDPQYGFIMIKVPETDPYTGFPTRYKAKHVWLWEYHNGPVPEGMVVGFIDGNRLNVVIENLMLISRAELLHLNQHGYKNAPDEIKPTVRLIVKLEVKGKFRTTGKAPGAGRQKKQASI